MPSRELVKVRDLLGRLDLSGSLAERRVAIDSFDRPLPPGSTVTPADGPVAAEWVVGAGVDSVAVLVYVHGGGYHMGSARGQRYLVGALSAASQMRVLNVDYRLAPEHPFPAAVDDTIAAYRWVLGQGIPAQRIALAGDSAGGGLTLGTLLALKDVGDPRPAAAVAISPLTDLKASGDSMRTRADLEIILRPGAVEEAATWYLNGESREHPYASPLYGDLTGLPPLLLQAGDAEVLLDDSTRFAKKAELAGVDVTLEIWPEMPHVWHVFAGFLPEADQAIARIGKWLQVKLSAAPADV
jgi:acetyl esterase/lipase